MSIKIILNIALKLILQITNAHNIHQMIHWKQRTKKIVRPNSSQKINKQTTQKQENGRKKS
jgi:hypothetical protein